MAEVPVDKRFRGSIRLVTLLLWRIAKSTNVEDGFRAARELKMFDAENEAFTRRCFALDAQLEAGEELAEPLTRKLARSFPEEASIDGQPLCSSTDSPGRVHIGGSRSLRLGTGAKRLAKAFESAQQRFGI